MTGDWEMYFAIQEGRDDLVSIELDLDDLSDQSWYEINLAAYLLGQPVTEFVQQALLEYMARMRRWPNGYGGSPHSITGINERPCFVCEKPTVFVDVNFEAHICGGICEWAAWEAYFMALRDKDPWRAVEAA